MFLMYCNDEVSYCHQHGMNAEKLNKEGTSSNLVLANNLTRIARTSTL